MRLEAAEFNYQQTEAGLTRIKVEETRAQLSTELAKQRLLEEGNPGSDYRQEIVTTRINSLGLEKIVVQSALDSAIGTREYFKSRLAVTELLFAKKLDTVYDRDYKQSLVISSEETVQKLKHQLQSIDESITGLEKTRKRLHDNP